MPKREFEILAELIEIKCICWFFFSIFSETDINIPNASSHNIKQVCGGKKLLINVKLGRSVEKICNNWCFIYSYSKKNSKFSQHESNRPGSTGVQKVLCSTLAYAGWTHKNSFQVFFFGGVVFFYFFQGACAADWWNYFLKLVYSWTWPVILSVFNKLHM